MNKMNLSFNGNGATVLYDLLERKSYNYKNVEDRTILHEKFGGEQYYSSKSGLSGAGYILPAPNKILLNMGTYRPHVQNSRTEGETLLDWKIYFPVGNGMTESHPIIAVKEASIRFLLREEPLYSQLSCEYETREIQFPYLDSQGFGNSISIDFSNPSHLKGANLAEFADFSACLAERKKFEESIGGYADVPQLPPRTALNLGLVIGLLGGQYYVATCAPQGRMTKMWKIEDWENTFSHINNGWVKGYDTEVGTYFWKREGRQISVFLETKRSELGRGYSLANGDKFVTVQETCQIESFFDLEATEEVAPVSDDALDELGQALLRKARRDWVWVHPRHEPKHA